MHDDESSMSDWGERVNTIIEKSSKDLHGVSSEYKSHILDQYKDQQMKRKPGKTANTMQSCDGDSIFRDVLHNIENCRGPGPYQQAAIQAFHATTRPLSRGGAATFSRGPSTDDVDRLINDKLIHQTKA